MTVHRSAQTHGPVTRKNGERRPNPSIRVALQGCVRQRGGCGAHCPPEGWAGAVGRVVAGRTRMRRLGWRCRPSTFQVPYLPSNALTTEPGCFYGGPRAYEPPQHQDGAPSSPPGGLKTEIPDPHPTPTPLFRGCMARG